MATALDVITGAMRKLRVIASGELPEASEAEDGLTELNEMLFGWANDGIDMNHVAIVLTDTLDVPDDHLETIRLSLAERLQGLFGATLSQIDTLNAEKGRRALRAQYLSLGELGSESPLSRRHHVTDW